MRHLILSNLTSSRHITPSSCQTQSGILWNQHPSAPSMIRLARLTASYYIDGMDAHSVFLFSLHVRKTFPPEPTHQDLLIDNRMGLGVS